MRQAESDRRAAELELSFTRIEAPIGGLLTDVSARVGALVSPGDVLFAVLDRSRLFAEVRLPAREAARIEPGAPASVEVIGGETRSGRVVRWGGRVAQGTGDPIVGVEIDGDGLLPGMACRVRIAEPVVEKRLCVPLAAISDRSGVPVVSVVREGRAYEVEVELGARDRERVAVARGLEPGDRVVIEGGYGLPDGTPVREEPLDPAHP